MVVMSTPCLSEYGGVYTGSWLGVLLSALTARLCFFVADRGWTGVRGRGQAQRGREERSYLAKAVCLWSTETVVSRITSLFFKTWCWLNRFLVYSIQQSNNTYCLLMSSGYHRTFTLRSSYDLPYAVIVSCLGFVYTFFKLFLLLFLSCVQARGVHSRIDRCFCFGEGYLSLSGETITPCGPWVQLRVDRAWNWCWCTPSQPRMQTWPSAAVRMEWRRRCSMPRCGAAMPKTFLPGWRRGSALVSTNAAG